MYFTRFILNILATILYHLTSNKKYVNLSIVKKIICCNMVGEQFRIHSAFVEINIDNIKHVYNT